MVTICNMATGGSSIRITIPDIQQPQTEPAEMLQSDGSSAASAGPLEETGQLPSVGDSYEDVKLEAMLEPSEKEEDSQETPFEIE